MSSARNRHRKRLISMTSSSRRARKSSITSQKRTTSTMIPFRYQSPLKLGRFQAVRKVSKVKGNLKEKARKGKTTIHLNSNLGLKGIFNLATTRSTSWTWSKNHPNTYLVVTASNLVAWKITANASHKVTNLPFSQEVYRGLQMHRLREPRWNRQKIQGSFWVWWLWENLQL